jgi:hypothetical protein
MVSSGALAGGHFQAGKGKMQLLFLYRFYSSAAGRLR